MRRRASIITFTEPEGAPPANWLSPSMTNSRRISSTSTQSNVSDLSPKTNSETTSFLYQQPQLMPYATVYIFLLSWISSSAYFDLRFTSRVGTFLTEHRFLSFTFSCTALRGDGPAHCLLFLPLGVEHSNVVDARRHVPTADQRDREEKARLLRRQRRCLSGKIVSTCSLFAILRASSEQSAQGIGQQDRFEHGHPSGCGSRCCTEERYVRKHHQASRLATTGTGASARR